MRDLRSCDVTANKEKYSRDVESYDFSIKYRLNGENVMKRNRSNSDDSDSCGKRYKSSNPFSNINRFKNKQRKGSVKDRLGTRSDDSSNSNSNDGVRSITRNILDLAVTESSTNEQVANDIANKLYEEKDDLMRKFFLN